MNYIVFDLEWNQSPGGKRWSNSRLPFEIIEIGAVKLNEKKEIVDSFQRLVKPQVYNWIHDSIHEVIHMNYKDLQNGTPSPHRSRNSVTACGSYRVSGLVWRRIYFLHLGKSGCDGAAAEYEILWQAFQNQRSGDLL